MRRQRLILITSVVLGLGYAWLTGALPTLRATAQAAPVAQAGQEVATFAGGCFWCVEADFDKLQGVISTTSGYTGGRVNNPSDEQISRGGTGHVETLQIVFDPAVITFDQLLEHL